MSRAFRAAFREWFGLRPAEADLLVILYGAAGEFVARPAIAELAGVRGGSVNVHICHLRASLEAEAIDSAPRRGYRLTEQGMAECRGALWTMGEELRTAS
jgi:DNA-binding winged helix-turn-helix (wHTH) protein